MLIEVTQEHIDNGKKRDHCNCPVALAIKAHEPVEIAYVGGRTAFYALKGGAISGDVRLPLEAAEFIHKFDHDQPVEPFTFELPCILSTLPSVTGKLDSPAISE